MSRHRRTDARTHIVDGPDLWLLALAVAVVIAYLVVCILYTNGLLR